MPAWPHLAEIEISKRIGLEKGILDVYTDRTHMYGLPNGEKQTEHRPNGLESKEV
jgi:hypothetical protein